MERAKVLKILSTIDDLPTLPTLVVELDKMIKNYNTSVGDLSKVIEKDQSIVSKMLKLVNSAFFGLRSKVGNVSEAIVVLGFNSVHNIVLSLTIIDTLLKKGNFENFDVRSFWKHSIAVAMVSKYLAEHANIQPSDDVFVAGLLHDIGKVVLFQNFPQFFQKAWQESKGNELKFYNAEQMHNPINHTQIGAYLAEKWKLPENLIEVIKSHHKKTSVLNFIMIIQISDIIVNVYQVYPKGKINFLSLFPQAGRIMLRHLNAINDWFPELVVEIEDTCKIFLEGKDEESQ